MMDSFGIASVASITVICYLAAQIIKAAPLNRKWIPVLCGSLGGILGIIGFFAVPAFPAADVLSAVAMGIVSGLAATGANQIVKQMSASGNTQENK